MKNWSVSVKLMCLVGLSVIAFAGLGVYGISSTSSTFATIGKVWDTAEGLREISQEITDPLNELRRLSLSIVLAPDPQSQRRLHARRLTRAEELDQSLRAWRQSTNDPREVEAFDRFLQSWERYRKISDHTAQKAVERYREEAFINATHAEEKQFEIVRSNLAAWMQTRIEHSARVHQEAQDQHFRTTLVSAFVFLLMTLLIAAVGLLMARSIVRPIQALQSAATRIANREPITAIGVHSTDELGQLARHMESMAKSIRNYIEQQQRAEAETRSLNAELEQRVEQRTAELKAATETLRCEAQERRREEQRYRSLVEATTAIVWNTPPSGEFEMEQPGWSAFTGQNFQQLGGWGWLDAVHPDDRPNTAIIWSEAVASRSLYQVEHRLRRHDGVYRHMMVRAVPILDEAGDIREWIGIHTDIDDRKRAEEAVAERARLASLAADVGVALTGADTLPGILRPCAEAMVRHLGAAFARVWTLNETQNVLELQASAGIYTHTDGPHGRVPVGQFKIGMIAQQRRAHLTDDVPNDPHVSDPEWARREGMVAFAGHPLVVRNRLVGVMALFARTSLPEATLKALASVADEIALGIERVWHKEALERAKEAAEASAAWARLVVDTAYDAFVAMNEEGCIIDWNSQAEQTFGWSRAEAMGRLLADTVIPPDYRDPHTQGLARFLATGEGPVLNQRLELPALHRDGTRFPVELTIRPIRQGTRFIFTAFMHDISARKRAEEALREAKEAAELANRAKSDFLANMSHEIRTPMNGIIGMTELALDSELTSDQREFLDTVKHSADYLLAVINDILDFSKIEAGKLDLDPIDFNLRDHLEETLPTIALKAHAKGLELACHVLDDVPDALVGDPGRLRQILVNLLSNAVKFTAQGEVVVRVEKQEQTQTHVRLHFAIRDTGIGIPADKLGRLFKAFSQVDASTTRKFGGTGLGLAISAQLVRMMDGRVWVESEEGQGSTFHFTAQFGLARCPAVRQPPADLARLKDLPVLVVDDNATNRRLLRELLSKWGMQPTLVEDGQRALEAMRDASAAGRPYPIVLLDHMMPEMDGLMLASEIQRHPELAKSVLMMLSSTDRRETAALYRERGVSRHLTKPIRRAELLDALLALVGSPAPEQTRPVPRRSIAPGGRSLRLLLAEDNAVNQKLAVRLLEKRGHSVVVVGNGREALEALEKSAFDVVLMDVMMPEMDGFEATGAIRLREKEKGSYIPIIAMTAHAMKGDRERCLEVGMDGYVSKPLDVDELYETIDRVAARAETGREALVDGE